VRLSARGLELLGNLMTPGVVAAAKASAAPPDAEGWTRVTVPIESVGHATGEFLRLGAEAEVLEPDELRRAIAVTAAAVARRHGGDASRPATA
jgi:predicted DNA-binding transcriptional regulator YafY